MTLMGCCGPRRTTPSKTKLPQRRRRRTFEPTPDLETCSLVLGNFGVASYLTPTVGKEGGIQRAWGCCCLLNMSVAA